ncbi:MAG: hypothetical protein KDA92_21600 [Planctomycetales bacterium]|nr:hypothetical protein [Planctomycetales bacterium]
MSSDNPYQPPVPEVTSATPQTVPNIPPQAVDPNVLWQIQKHAKNARLFGALSFLAPVLILVTSACANNARTLIRKHDQGQEYLPMIEQGVRRARLAFLFFLLGFIGLCLLVCLLVFA